MVRFDNLTYSYPGKTGGLKNINLLVEKGSCVFICGSAAVYKTTILNLIYGQIFPSSGEIKIFDYVLPRDKKKLHKIRAKIGYAFHPLLFFENQTVRENLLIPILIRGKKNKNEINRTIDEYIGEMTDLNPLSLVKTLSSSEKQKLNLLRAFIVDPVLLLADEPFKYLHKDDIEKWVRIFQDKTNSGMTIIATSANTSVLEKYNIKFYILENGIINACDEK